LVALTTAKLPRREGAATATAAKDAIMVSDAIAFALLGLLVVTVVVVVVLRVDVDCSRFVGELLAAGLHRMVMKLRSGTERAPYPVWG
jgi:hypothetical protein